MPGNRSLGVGVSDSGRMTIVYHWSENTDSRSRTDCTRPLSVFVGRTAVSNWDRTELFPKRDNRGCFRCCSVWVVAEGGGGIRY